MSHLLLVTLFMCSDVKQQPVKVTCSAQGAVTWDTRPALDGGVGVQQRPPFGRADRGWDGGLGVEQ